MSLNTGYGKRFPTKNFSTKYILDLSEPVSRDPRQKLDHSQSTSGVIIPNEGNSHVHSLQDKNKYMSGGNLNSMEKSSWSMNGVKRPTNRYEEYDPHSSYSYEERMETSRTGTKRSRHEKSSKYLESESHKNYSRYEVDQKSNHQGFHSRDGRASEYSSRRSHESSLNDYSSRDYSPKENSRSQHHKNYYGRESYSRDNSSRDDFSRGRRDSNDRFSNKSRNRSPIAMFDKYSTDGIGGLSPYPPGTIPPLEERQMVLRNWDAAPPGFENVDVMLAKQSGLFPPPGNPNTNPDYKPPTMDGPKLAIVSMINGSEIKAQDLNGPVQSSSNNNISGNIPNLPGNSNSQLNSKHARRVFVTNLPPPGTFSEADIREFFDSQMLAIKPLPPNSFQQNPTYVMNVEIGQEGGDYAFVEFRSFEDAELATNLDNANFSVGYDSKDSFRISVRRTREFQQTSSAEITIAEVSFRPPKDGLRDSSRLLISGIPHFFTESHLAYLLAPFGTPQMLRILDEHIASDLQASKSAVVSYKDETLISDLARHLDGFILFSSPENENLAFKKGQLEPKSDLTAQDQNKEKNADSSDINVQTETGMESQKSESRENMEAFKKTDPAEYKLSARPLDQCIEDPIACRMLSYYALTPGEATYSVSPVLQLLNMVIPADISTESNYASILEEVRRECSQYGDIVSILIPRPESKDSSMGDSLNDIVALPSCGVGKIFVEYRLSEECRRAITALAGRLFNKRTVLASHYSPIKYHKGIF